MEPRLVELAFFSVKYYSEISLNSSVIANKTASSLVVLSRCHRLQLIVGKAVPIALHCRPLSCSVLHAWAEPQLSLFFIDTLASSCEPYQVRSSQKVFQSSSHKEVLFQ